MIDGDINRERYHSQDFEEKKIDLVENDIYGEDLDPKRSTRLIRAKNFERQHIVDNNDPSSILPGATLSVEIPKLAENDMIVPGSFFISFKLDITSKKDTKRSVVPNIGRKIIKYFTVKFEGEPVLSIENYDEIMTYFDFFLSKKEKSRRIFQGIQTDAGLRIRVNSEGATGNTEEVAIGKTLKNRFRIPIDFELLNDMAPFPSRHLQHKLQFELTFNDAKSVILGSTPILASANDHDYNYLVYDIKREYDVITDSNLRRLVVRQYNEGLIVPVRHIFHYRKEAIKKSDTIVNININIDVNSLTHLLILAIDPNDRKDFARNDNFKNLDVKDVKVSISGKPNKLYANNLLSENTYEQILKLFDGNSSVTIGEFLTTKYGLCLDFRPSTDFKLHGNGHKLEKELKIEINRAPTGNGDLILHIFLLKDGHLNIYNNRVRDNKILF